MNEDLTFLTLRQIQANPKISQRDLAKGIGMSLGRTNDIQRKRLEYDALQAQLEQITAEAQAAGLIDPSANR